MTDKNELVLVFTGNGIIIQRIKTELELNGIASIIQDGFKSGIAAGFGGGIPSAIDLFVVERDVEKASKIIKAIVE